MLEGWLGIVWEDVRSGSQEFLHLRVGFGDEFDDKRLADVAAKIGDHVKREVVGDGQKKLFALQRVNTNLSLI